jgi:hypothetical protein
MCKPKERQKIGARTEIQASGGFVVRRSRWKGKCFSRKLYRRIFPERPCSSGTILARVCLLPRRDDTRRDRNSALSHTSNHPQQCFNTESHCFSLLFVAFAAPFLDAGMSKCPHCFCLFATEVELTYQEVSRARKNGLESRQ